MDQTRKFEVIVIGAGILGLACTNRLVQEYPHSVLNLSKSIGGQSTLKNQNWLQSGAALLFDPVDEVPALAVDSFVDTKHAMGLPVGKRRFDYKSAVLAIPSRKEAKLIRLRKHAEEAFPKHFGTNGSFRNCSFAEKVIDHDDLRERLGDYYSESPAVYYNIHDDSFQLTMLVNQLINGVDEISNARSVFKVVEHGLEIRKSDEGYLLADGNGNEFLTRKVILCAGGGTMPILQGIDLEEWERAELDTAGFQVLRSPVLSYRDKSEVKTELFINAMQDFAVMRHYTLIEKEAYQYATCHRDFHLDPAVVFSTDDSKVNNLKNRLDRAGVHQGGDYVDGLFCNRIERRVGNAPTGCVGHTVEPFIIHFESHPHLVAGLPGKATFALNLSAEMLVQLGIDEPPDLKLGSYSTENLHVIHHVNENPFRLQG